MDHQPIPTDRSQPWPLALQVERDHITAWQSRRDHHALQQLLSRYLPRMRSLARCYSREMAEDLAMEGVVALIEALKRYQPQGDVPFLAFATPAVRGAMLRAFAAQSGIVSMPERQLRDALSGRLGPDAADALRQSLQAESFDELAADAAGDTAEDTALGQERLSRIRSALANALAGLEKTERQLVIHHILKEDKPLETLAQDLKLPLSRLRLIEGRALHKMRNRLMTKGIMMSDLA